MSIKSFQLCNECRKAFNFSGADSSAPLARGSELQGPRVVEDGARRDEESSAVDRDVLPAESSEVAGAEVLSSGSEGSPSCKRSRVEETPNTSSTTSTPSAAGVPGAVELDHEGEGQRGLGGMVLENTSNETSVEEGDSMDTMATDAMATDAMATSAMPPTDAMATDAMATPVCSGCLGLLDDGFVSTLTTAVGDELAKVNYEGLKTFSLSISTPLSLIIRQCGVLFYLKDNFEITDEPPEACVKESLRHKLYSQLREKLSPLKIDVESPFQIILKLDHSGSTMECRLAAQTWPDAFPVVKKRFRRRGKGKGKEKTSVSEPVPNTNSVKTAVESATGEDFKRHDFLSAVGLCTYSIELSHSPLFVGGRYCKYSRELSQTPWFIGEVRKGETSVQELICDHIQEFVRSSNVKFSSSGREDCDVRMLGNGRPFLIELLNPKKTELQRSEVDMLQSKINSSTKLVEVKKLRVLSKAAGACLKEGEQEKRKEYRALVWAPETVTQDTLDKLGAMEDTLIHQKTPIRVLHRRSLATRDRMVHKMRGELANDHHFYLHLTTQAGTYIKEFVHGDFGRTQPNLRTIMGQEVDILTLDVCEVLLDWPPTQQS